MLRRGLIFFFLGALVLQARDAGWISTEAKQNAFALFADGRAAELVVSPDDARVVTLAANDLAADIARVTGTTPVVRASPAVAAPGPVVLIGTLGKNPLIDELVAGGRLDVTALRGQWETFLIATVAPKESGAADLLVIVGSDRRGTAFGVYELSQAIGVSPWHWWADVAPAKKSGLYVEAGVRKMGPPSVRYRGIFINDEDWGLQPWAARTFAPEEKGIGPKTYKKVFELLLRLKANTLWPAMHACSPAFNFFPENARLADEYAIVMGSSHAEPMLRNNVTEWTAPPEDFDYVKNATGVRRYWAERVASNGRFENIYTIGMRGIHDSGMTGPKTDAERIGVLEQIFSDQRAMLRDQVDARVDRVPQLFCAYKEVLDLYRQGLQVPDDVTIMWPDDNFGYIRNFATPAAQTRSGGYGVYYHLSYLGRPLAYLWLNTVPPALIWSEMTKAYDHGARQIWIANVGDLKPAEIGTEFFLQLAWDVQRWQPDSIGDFLVSWAAREFGPDGAQEIAAIMNDYYQLNFSRKPEHLQWWLPKEDPRPSPLSETEITARLAAFASLVARVAVIEAGLPATKRAAFYQLVAYPVRGAALANERYFYGELAARAAGDPELVAKAASAHTQLQDATRWFNEELSGGKWRHLMQLEPADADWRGMRIAPWSQPDFCASSKTVKTPAIPVLWTLPATTDNPARWTKIPGLGRSARAMTVLPTTAPVRTWQRALDAPQVSGAFTIAQAGRYRVTFSLLPTHPLVAGRGLRFAFALADGPPQAVTREIQDGGPAWAQGVLNNELTVSASLGTLAPGRHSMRLFGLEPGVVIDGAVVEIETEDRPPRVAP